MRNLNLKPVNRNKANWADIKAKRAKRAAAQPKKKVNTKTAAAASTVLRSRMAKSMANSVAKDYRMGEAKMPKPKRWKTKPVRNKY